MRVIFILFLSTLFSGKIYVSLQMLDQVGIVDSETLELIDVIHTDFNDISTDCMNYSSEMDCNMATGCEWMMGMCMESSDSCMDYSSEMDCNMAAGCEWMMDMCMESGGMQMGNNTPHFVAIDDINGYWFVTTIASGYIAQFELVTNNFVDKIFVGDSPALLTLNKHAKKIYCSRMMPMGSMMTGSESAIIHEIDYSGNMLMTLNEFEIPSPAPHGIAINSNGSEVYVASNTADWIYKIIPSSGDIIGSVMDDNIDNSPNIETQRLKPIQCLSVGDSLLFVTCSGGQWFDPWTGNQEEIAGQVQLWDSNAMIKLDTYEFDWYSSPWHIVNDKHDNRVYLALAGDGLYEGSSGVASLSYDNSNLSLDWFTSNDVFDTLHGIDISDEGEQIYVSGRGDGNLHVLNLSGDLINSIPLSVNGDMVMAGGVAFFSDYNQGNLNDDDLIDIFDIILLVSYILGNLENYNEILFNTSGDLNIDGSIDILDVMLLANIILNNN